MEKYGLFCLSLFTMPIFAADCMIQPGSKQFDVKVTEKLWNIIWYDDACAKQAQELLEKGANPNDHQFEFGAIEEGWDMLSASILQGHFDLIKPLLNAGADPKKCLYPPIGFMSSLVHGYVGCCKQMRTLGVDHEDYCFFSRVQNKFSDQKSFKQAYKDALECLIAHKADCEACIQDQPKSAFVLAREYGHQDICVLLLKSGGAQSNA